MMRKLLNLSPMAVVAIAVLILAPACGGGSPTAPPFVEPPEPTPVGFSFQITSGPTPPAPAKGLIVHEDEISMEMKYCVDNTIQLPVGKVWLEIWLFDENGKEIKSGSGQNFGLDPGCALNAHEFTSVAFRPGHVTSLLVVYVEPQSGDVLWQRKVCATCPYAQAMVDHTWIAP